MTNIRHRYVNNGGSQSLGVVVDGRVHVIDNTNIKFQAALAAVRAGDMTALRDALDLDALFRNALAAVSNGFAYTDGVITYNGVEVSGKLAEMIRSTIQSEGDVRPFANFAARLAANPSFNSRKALFGWIDRWGINLDRDGNLIAYKGVRVDENGDYVSITAGKGFVNGDAVEGHLRNNIGDVVEVPRQDVDDNVNVHCSYGLHAGTYNYASSFARGVLLTVKIDPADVVSVPNDGYEKIRCSRYEVIASVEGEFTDGTVWDGVLSSDPLDFIGVDPDDDDFLTF